MNVYHIKNVYFLGIGGIGMSALARFFRERGALVSGYDKTPTALTAQLEQEGMAIHYTDDPALADAAAQLVVYTPAIPKDHREYNDYLVKGYPVYKRSDVLQWITEAFFAVTVAGTHGKTTISTMTAYLLREAGKGCNAFLGGISANYDTNYWSSPENTTVVEADEYDRSFLKLRPDVAVLTAMDPDHLDIYGTAEAMEEAFIAYTHNIKPGGTLIVKKGLHRSDELQADNTITYALNDATADVHAANIRIMDGNFMFDMVWKDGGIADITLGIGGLHNVENALAAVTAARMAGVDEGKVGTALAAFKGVKRRFEYIVRTPDMVYIDDYAHHPAELEALLGSAKRLYPGRKCVVCFQPHLFSRTRDFAAGFTKSLDMADEVLLLDIYPARELPIPGVESQMLLDGLHHAAGSIVTKEGLLEYVKNNPLQLLVTAGAGDIDKLVQPIANILNGK